MSSFSSAEKIAQLKRQIAREEEYIAGAPRRSTRLDSWEARVEEARKANFRTHLNMEKQQESLGTHQAMAAHIEAPLNMAKQLSALEEELSWLDSRRVEILGEIEEASTKVGAFRVGDSLDMVRFECEERITKDNAEWEVPEGPDGRLSMALCPLEMRKKYWRLRELTSKCGERDPNAPGCQYKPEDFFLVARMFGWTECPKEEAARIARVEERYAIQAKR